MKKCSLNSLCRNQRKSFKQEQDTAIAVVKIGDEYKTSYAQASWETEGSGVCRYDIWTFDFDGKISVKTPGCYGEILPPKDWEVKGELLLHDPGIDGSFVIKLNRYLFDRIQQILQSPKCYFYAIMKKSLVTTISRLPTMSNITSDLI